MHENERMRKISDERLSRQAQDEEPVKALSAAQRAALAVAKDYPVFPVEVTVRPDGNRKKEPLTRHGFKDATQDAAIVTRWWRQYPQALIGVPTGSASGLLAIDIDPPGRQWFEAHRRELGTYQTRQTPRGKHLLYQYPKGSGISSPQNSPVAGVDVRGEGGYMLWWPALEELGKPGSLPGWLRKALTKQPVRKLTNGHAHDTPVDWVEERKRVIEALGQLDPDLHHDEWRDVLAAISNESNGAEDGENIAVAYSRGDYWSAPATTFPGEQAVRKKYRSFKNQKETNITIATLFKMVKDRDGKVPAGRPDKKANGKESGKVVLARADTIDEVPVDWLWKGVLARNKLHLLSGAGGSMKSTLTLHMAAVVSTGGVWPDGNRCPRGNVIIWTGEDDLNDTVKPRLRFAGADLKRCYFVDAVKEEGKKRSFNPAADIPKLAEACARLKDISLIIIDPAVSVVQRDSNSASEVRRGLDPLFALGHEYHAAIVGIHHLNKGSKGRTPGERVTGSGAWTQAPRLSLMVGAVDAGDDQVPNRWVFVCEKTFSKGKGGGYEYTFEEEPKTEITRIVWGRRLEGSAQSILAEAEGTEADGSKIAVAVKFLRNLLANGSVSVWDINRQAEDAEIRGITLRRAKEELKVETIRAGKNSYRWALPEG